MLKIIFWIKTSLTNFLLEKVGIIIVNINMTEVFTAFYTIEIFLKKHNLKFTNYRRFQDAIFFVTSMTEAKYFYAICKYSYAYRKNHKNIVWTYKNVYDHLNALHSYIMFFIGTSFQQPPLSNGKKFS
mgnify:CR=1 FL=1